MIQAYRTCRLSVFVARLFLGTVVLPHTGMGLVEAVQPQRLEPTLFWESTSLGSGMHQFVVKLTNPTGMPLAVQFDPCRAEVLGAAITL